MAATDALAQLAEELGQRLHSLSLLAGLDDVGDPWATADLMAARTIGPLCSDDDTESAQAVIDVMWALWPSTCEPPDEWWRTPLGRIVARSIATDDESVTYAAAAAMLGVARGTVSTMVSRGTLDRHPDGGVARSAVMARLGR